MSNFANTFKNVGNITHTENGGVAFRTTHSDLLDFYAKVGGMRHEDAARIINNYSLARKENAELADNLILYARNVRDGGLGERKIGRILLKQLAMRDPAKVERNFEKIVDTGRWDDLFVLEGTAVENAMFDFIEAQFRKDVLDMRANKPISLLAKWMPSINTSSNETKRLANKICKKFGLTARTYRKTLSAMRKYLDVVERKMSAGQWNEINFEGVPSVAMSRYIKTFNIHVPEAFTSYKQAVVKGEAKVNAAALTPSAICKKYLMGGRRYGWGYSQRTENVLDTIDEEQWKALPNYVDGSFDVVVMADVSGSMTCCDYEPMAASIGLATYFAQRNKGAYHGMYLSFTDDPHFININDHWSAEQCFRYVEQQGVGYSTNLDRAMQAVYEVAVRAHEAPKALIVISDGEFNRFEGEIGQSIVAKWNEKFIAAGLGPVKVISWNVASRHDHVMAPASDNVAYVSGSSAGAFKDLIHYITKDAYTAMVEVLTKPEFCWD